MRILFSNYHISVNKGLVDDLVSIGLDVVMPTQGDWPIRFFAPNHEHRDKAAITSYDDFLGMPPMVILIPCTQMVEDLLAIWRERGERDVLVLLTANSDHQQAWRMVPTDYLISHDLTYHREWQGPWKMLYFSRPLILRAPKTGEQLAQTFEEKKVKVYINNLESERHSVDGGLKPEYDAAMLMRELWQERTGFRVPIYGYGNADGWPSMEETQNHLVDSMFTFVSKRRETWGQVINESMQLGTPGMFLRPLLNSTFTEYLIREDTAILGDTVEELVDKALSLTFEQYQSLVNEAYSQSQMFCAEGPRRAKLSWLFDKVAKDPRLAG